MTTPQPLFDDVLTDRQPEALDETSASSPLAPPSQPARRWPWWVRGVIVPMVLMLGNYLLFIPASMLVGPSVAKLPLPAQSVVFIFLGCLVPLVAVTAIVVLMRRVDRRPLREAGLFFDRGSLPGFLIGLGAAALVVIPLGFGLQAAGLLRGGDISNAPLYVKIITVIVLGLIVQGFPEELLWRGYQIQTLPWTNRWVVALFSAGLFALMHLVSNGGQENLLERFLYIVQAFAFAFLAAALYQLTGQLWAAVGVHAGMHFCHGITEGFGVGSGPTLWIAESTGYLAIAVAVLLWLDKNRPDAPAAGRRLPA